MSFGTRADTPWWRFDKCESGRGARGSIAAKRRANAREALTRVIRRPHDENSNRQHDVIAGDSALRCDHFRDCLRVSTHASLPSNV
jgi:hypothetical protein